MAIVVGGALTGDGRPLGQLGSFLIVVAIVICCHGDRGADRGFVSEGHVPRVAGGGGAMRGLGYYGALQEQSVTVREAGGRGGRREGERGGRRERREEGGGRERGEAGGRGGRREEGPVGGVQDGREREGQRTETGGIFWSPVVSESLLLQSGVRQLSQSGCGSSAYPRPGGWRWS